MPDRHARLSPSASERWLSCPASVRASEALDLGSDEGSVFAQEGTNAHTLAELRAREQFIANPPEADFDAWYSAVKAADNDPDEMEGHVLGYVSFLGEILDATPNSVLMLEQKLDTGIDSSWGTSDAVVVSPDVVHIVDFKYGTGIRVDSHDNPQLMLYALGALLGFGELLGHVRTIRMSIYQPRIDNVCTSEITVEALLKWAEWAAERAALALGPDAPFGPSPDACRWCPVAGDCSARTQLIISEFEATPPAEVVNPDLMPAEDLARVLAMLPEIEAWLSAVRESALRRAYSEGEAIPGWKVVRTNGRRVVADQLGAVQTLIDAGYNAEQVATFKLRGLGELDKLIGKNELANLLAGNLSKTEGNPAMAPADDPRPAASPEARALEMFG